MPRKREKVICKNGHPNYIIPQPARKYYYCRECGEVNHVGPNSKGEQ